LPAEVGQEQVDTMSETITITQVKSGIGSTEKIRATLVGLGLTKMHKTIVRKNTPEIQGMVRKVQHLVKVEE
jgi:large subunit ribosomal protein L30